MCHKKSKQYNNIIIFKFITSLTLIMIQTHKIPRKKRKGKVNNEKNHDNICNRTHNKSSSLEKTFSRNWTFITSKKEIQFFLLIFKLDEHLLAY